MLPTLRIEKLNSDQYRGRILVGRALLGETYQPTLADVIGEAAKVFQPAAIAFNVYYGPVSVSTITRERMMHDAETFAHRLVMLEALLAEPPRSQSSTRI